MRKACFLAVAIPFALPGAATAAASIAVATRLPYDAVWSRDGVVSIAADAPREFVVPPLPRIPGKTAAVRFRSRIAGSQGWNSFLGIWLNGVPLTRMSGQGKWRLLNRAATLASKTGTESMASGNHYLTFFTDDFDRIDPGIIDAAQRTESTWFVLEIGDLVREDRHNILRLANAYSGACVDVTSLAVGYVAKTPASQADMAALQSASNPTLFTATGASGLGVFAQDTPFRNHLVIETKGNAAQFGFREIGLAPREAYESRWRIYPIDDGDYFTFINRLRANLGANHTILGPGKFLADLAGRCATTATGQLRDYIDRQYAAIGILHPWFCYYDGGLHTPDRWLAAIRPSIENLKRGFPSDVRLIPAFEISLQPVPKSLDIHRWPADAAKWPTADGFVVQQDGSYSTTMSYTLGLPWSTTIVMYAWARSTTRNCWQESTPRWTPDAVASISTFSPPRARRPMTAGMVERSR